MGGGDAGSYWSRCRQSLALYEYQGGSSAAAAPAACPWPRCQRTHLEHRHHCYLAALQVYVMKRRDVTEQMIREVERLGYTALVVTVDAPRLGERTGCC